MMSCRLTKQLRRNTWSTETTQEEKLWGEKEKLHSTASIIEVQDLSLRKMTAEGEE